MRLRIKIYPKDGRQWLVLSAFAVDRNHPPILTVIMAGEGDRSRTEYMTVDQYNALEYHWFEDVGPAPHGTAVMPEAIRCLR